MSEQKNSAEKTEEKTLLQSRRLWLVGAAAALVLWNGSKKSIQRSFKAPAGTVARAANQTGTSDSSKARKS